MSLELISLKTYKDQQYINTVNFIKEHVSQFASNRREYYSSICGKAKILGKQITWQKTNALKISVFSINPESGPSRWKRACPLVWRYQTITNWYNDCPKIFLHITLLMKFPFRPTGNLFIKSSVGGSVANARAPSVSIIMLTQSSCTAVRGAFPEETHPQIKYLHKI